MSGIRRANGGVAASSAISLRLLNYWPSKVLSMLWSIFAILLILWLLGFGYHMGGALIHLLLVAAVLVLIVSIVRPDVLHRHRRT